MTGGKLDTAGLAVLVDERVARLQHVVNTQREIIAVLERELRWYAQPGPDGAVARQALEVLESRRREFGR